MQVVHLLELIVALGFFSLILAFNPLLIIIGLVVAIKSKQPIRDIALITGGIFCSLLIVVLIGRFIIDQEIYDNIKSIKERLVIPPGLISLVGLSLIAFAVSRWRKLNASQLKKSPKKFSELSYPNKPKAIFSFSFFKSSLSLSNILVVLYIVLTLQNHGYSTLENMLIFLWIFLIVFIPFICLVYWRELRPNIIARIQSRLDALSAENMQLHLVQTLIIIGTIMVIAGAIKVAMT